jgi:hypothetical protein
MRQGIGTAVIQDASMKAPSSWPQLVFWREGERRCELWMSAGSPELRIYVGDMLLYKEHAPLESLYERAEQLRDPRPGTPPQRAPNSDH